MKRKFINFALLFGAAVFTLASCQTNTSPSGNTTSGGQGSQTTSSKADVNTDWDGKTLATGTFDFTGLSDADKTVIAGEMEAYAMYNHLTGIPLYGNGGYSLLNDRITLPAGSYVDNYGFGTLREGKITADLDSEANAAQKRYLHSGLSSAPQGDLNPFDAANTTSSSILGNMTASFYSTRLVKDGKGGYKNQWEWYSQLAKEDPIPLDENYSTTGSSKSWKIKLRTGDDGVYFRTASTKSIGGTQLSTFNNKPVTLDDYVFGYKALFNGMNHYTYAAQFISGSGLIEGIDDYYNNTIRNKTYLGTAEEENLWKNVGIKEDKSDNSLTITFKYPQSLFNARMNVQTAAIPVNQEFYRLITNNYKNPKDFGAKSTVDSTLSPVDTMLSFGPYVLSKYEAGSGSDGEIVLDRNDNYFERQLEDKDGYEIYSIPGVKYLIRTSFGQSDGAYNAFMGNQIDTSGIPQTHLDEWNKTNDGKGHSKFKTQTDSVWALQINSTTQERHDEIFGPQGYIWNLPTATEQYQAAYKYNVKPIMSNDNFLNGVYFAINRESLAKTLGNDIGYTYFADNAISDLTNNTSYNSTEAHKKAIKNYYPETYSYNKDIASQLFLKAVDELQADDKYVGGSASNPVYIDITIEYQLQTQLNEEGAAIQGYLYSAFNTDAMKQKGVELRINNYYDSDQSNGGVYNHIKRGMFDFAFGSISGSPYNLFDKFSLLLDTNETGLTLSWGKPTNEIGDNYKNSPIVYDGKAFTFEAMYNAVTYGGTVVKDGVFEKNND